MKFVLLKLSAVLILVLLTFNSCQKERETGYFDLSNGEVELSYNETQCSDPWYELVVSNKERSKENILRDYFRQMNISYLDLAYDKVNQDQVITCTACTCYTGSVFYVKIKEGQSDFEKLQKIGFKL